MYRARAELSREGRDYRLERELLNRYEPVWGFIPNSWNIEEYFDGEIFERLRCEMSLPQKDSWHGLVILGLLFPKQQVKHGLTYNAAKNVVVFVCLAE